MRGGLWHLLSLRVWFDRETLMGFSLEEEKKKKPPHRADVMYLINTRFVQNPHSYTFRR